MMRSLFSGVAGLKTHQTKMDVIGNNIANVNTVGYKSNSVTFNSLFYQTSQNASGANANVGGTNAKQIGLGVKVAAISTKMDGQGSAQSTGQATDLMMTGSNFFIVSDGSNTYFTRDGSFYVDGVGNLCMSSNGYMVQGWLTETDNEGNRVIKQDTVKPIPIMTAENTTYPPEATGKAYLSGILDKNDTQLSTDSGKIMNLNFYDNLGYSYTARLSIHKTSTSEAGNYYMQLDDIRDANGVSLKEIYHLGNGADISQIAQLGTGNLTTTVTKNASIGTGVSFKTNTKTFSFKESTPGTPDYTISGNTISKSGGSETYTVIKGKIYDATGTTPINLTTLETIYGDIPDVDDTNFASFDYTINSDGTLSAQTYTYEYNNANDTAPPFSVTVKNAYNLPATDLNVTDLVYAEAVMDGTTEVHAKDSAITAEDFNKIFGTDFTSLNDIKSVDVDQGGTISYDLTLSGVNGVGISFDPSTGACRIDDPEAIVLQFQPDAGGLTLNNFGDENRRITIDATNTKCYNNGKTSTINATAGSTSGADAGRKVGKMSGFTISTDGTIYATYDNGQTKLLGQIATASFANPMGLKSEGDNLYSETLNSGKFDGVGVDVTAGGDGYISSGVLEMSNVDLSAEFTDMITTQRGFQANSRIITVSDSMLEELTNLKR